MMSQECEAMGISMRFIVNGQSDEQRLELKAPTKFVPQIAPKKVLKKPLELREPKGKKSLIHYKAPEPEPPKRIFKIWRCC